ncbi:MAG: histidine kinase dimerization/phosphoacceptor domain -containing protein, partial [Spirochaetaceae bacterium]|nr:histidine kinase dimerization/phosphoacceptor domain -containing protein [Spirochaetaceae bacterium]
IMEVMAAKAGVEIERERNVKALRSLYDEREIILKEIHHRVKNNLQLISSLVDLQQAQERSPGAAAALATIGNRIKSMALIHESLYASVATNSSRTP